MDQGCLPDFTLLSRFAPVWDLLFCAKCLFVAANHLKVLMMLDARRWGTSADALPLSRQPVGHQPFLGIAAGALSEPGTQ
jgi:hypothetical protein